MTSHDAMPCHLFSCFGRKTSSSKKEALENPTTDMTRVDEGRRGAVVVELFSSQGCGTSPEAELVLSRLGKGNFNLEVPVIVLAYHVDYWDHVGWKDPFGSSLWTVRQKAYVEALKLDTIFTPQVVVQGTAQCVANDQEAILSTIASVSPFPAPTLQATFQRPSAETLQVSVTGALRSKVDSNGANVMVALYENGLVTDCTKGENKGKVLPNDFVVRKLEKLCSVKDISAKKTVSGTVNCFLWEGFNSNKCGVAVFIQQNGSHHILGAQNFQLPEGL